MHRGRLAESAEADCRVPAGGRDALDGQEGQRAPGRVPRPARVDGEGFSVSRAYGPRKRVHPRHQRPHTDGRRARLCASGWRRDQDRGEGMTDSWDVRILTASSRREGPQEEPVIELFGRTRDGRSIVAEYWGFKPYFYAVRPSQVLVNYLQRDSEVLKVETVELEVQGRKAPCGKVTLQHPWKTPEYRERARKHGSEVMAADIPFAHRFIYDHDIAACVRVHGTPATGKYTTELVARAERFEPCEPFNPRLKVVSFDIENTITDPTILCLGLAWREDGALKTDILHGDEKEIIRRVIDFIAKMDPDVITGHTIDGNDRPTLEQRGQAHGIVALPLSRDGQGISSIGERFWRAHGPIIADAWWDVQLPLHPKQETLDAVGKWLLGGGKQDVDRV